MRGRQGIMPGDPPQRTQAVGPPLDPARASVEGMLTTAADSWPSIPVPDAGVCTPKPYLDTCQAAILCVFTAVILMTRPDIKEAMTACGG